MGRITVGSLETGASFVTLLTRRLGTVLGRTDDGVIVKFDDGAHSELHPDVKVVEFAAGEEV